MTKKDPDRLTNDDLGDNESKLKSEGGEAEYPTILKVIPKVTRKEGITQSNSTNIVCRHTRSHIGRTDQL